MPNMGEIIKKLRIDNGMTLEELGNKVGVGKSTVRKWENGMIANMRRDKIAKVAKVFGVSPAYLMEWEDSKPDFIFTLSNGSKVIIECMSPPKQEQARKLLTYYFALSELGQKKALDNIEDLAKIYSETKTIKYDFTPPEPIAEKSTPYGLVAAHNDHLDDDGELEKVKSDLELLKKPKEK